MVCGRPLNDKTVNIIMTKCADSFVGNRAFLRGRLAVNIINRIESAFSELERSGQLKQGNGIYDFEEFQIHV